MSLPSERADCQPCQSRAYTPSLAHATRSCARRASRGPRYLICRHGYRTSLRPSASLIVAGVDHTHQPVRSPSSGPTLSSAGCRTPSQASACPARASTCRKSPSSVCRASASADLTSKGAQSSGKSSVLEVRCAYLELADVAEHCRSCVASVRVRSSRAQATFCPGK